MEQSGFPSGRSELLPTPPACKLLALQRALVGEGVQRLSDAVNLRRAASSRYCTMLPHTALHTPAQLWASSLAELVFVNF